MSTIIEHPELNQTELPEFPVKRWTLEEYHRLVDTGVLDDVRVELVEGWITPKMTRNTLHDGTLQIVHDVLIQIVGRQLLVRNQSAFTTLTSELEPDFAIVKGTHREYLQRHPGGMDTLLIVEVADSSLPKDRRKALIYAGAGVPEYWIINLQQNCVEVFQKVNPQTHQYSVQHIHTREQTLTFQLGEQKHSIAVVDLIPPADLEPSL